ncbi:hypothetical protein ABGB12_09295 [Actinocorallia sp. B10E7]|uniref:hypothetical protein n=1 Tax=Actinocorallia sp. B10E7 TaxID=3153558 RepID=UPI00325CB6D2
MTASGGVTASAVLAEGGINLFGTTFPTFALFLFALSLFFLTGVYSFFKQGLKGAAIIVLMLAVLSFVAGLGRM